MSETTYYPIQYDPKWKLTPAQEMADAIGRCREVHGIEPDIVLCSISDAAAVGAVAGVTVRGERFVAPHVWYPGKEGV